MRVPHWLLAPWVVAVVTLMSAASHAQAPTPPEAGDATRGGKLYTARCGACHSIESNRVGPAHRGVFGRQAGAVDGYKYSKALAASDLTWDAVTLDEWLANPTKLVPGTAMGVRVPRAQDRSDIIAYLASQAAAD